ncbi:MAG TPA: DNA-directed RNA polymerase subunit alpha [Anaerolineales bacterium]|nr:DNA-directed RNA polymerase subunit alpha [Anaerolineales bacterium]
MSTNQTTVTPKIEADAVTRSYGRFHIGPLESGYGQTIGNALRRVLLSSLPGTAITSIRVADVYHEYSAIDGVREDMTQLLLNIKQVRLIIRDTENVRLRLEVHGEGVVTAGDIICPPEVEIVNPDCYLLTVDNDDLNFEMEMTAQVGRGFSPAEDRGRLPIGELPVDAIFSPVNKVNYEVERARVGQDTNYDRLVLEVWTDGTISPEQAISSSAAILIQKLQHIVGLNAESLLREPAPIAKEPEANLPSEIYDAPIETLDLSVRVFNSLKRTGIVTVGEVLDQLTRGADVMLAIRNFGEKSLDELKAKLIEKGYLTDTTDEDLES